MSDIEQTDDEGVIEIAWLELLIVIAILALTFQIWPNFYFKSADVIYDSLDITAWGWQEYAIANVVAFIGLAGVKLWQKKSG